MQRKHLRIVGVLAIAGLALCLGAVATQRAFDGEMEISLAQAPQAVRTTILAQAQGSPVDEIEMETENGQTVYEAEVLIGGKKVEIEVAADGTLLGTEMDDEEDDEEDENEVQISLADAPQAVQTTLAKEATGAEIKEIEREIEGGQTVYSAEVMIGGQEVEFEIAPDGTLLGKKVEDEDE